MHCRRVKTKTGEVWACVDDGPRNPVTGKRRQIERRAKTQKEAKKRVEDVIESLKEDGIDKSIAPHMTFEKIASKWLQVYAATGVKRGTVRIREKEIKILNKHFAKTPISEINHFMYQNTLLKLDEQGYAKNTINGVNTCANMIFKYAKRNKLIKENPRDGAVVPKKSLTVEDLETNKIEETYFDSDELDLFLDAVLKIGLDLDKERFFTLAFSGMRPGELIALKKPDSNFKENTIRISKTLYNENNNMKEYILETTKTKKARIIDMDEAIMKMLKQLVRKNDKHKLKYRTVLEDFHDKDFLFQRHNGYPFVIKTISTRMKRILKYADIKKDLTPHSFRHTHISMMTESGADLPTIMERVGHEDPDTTLKVYTHVTNKMKVKTLNKVSNLHQDILAKITN